ncbi:MAG: MBL fold metallo-hydrolase [Candidatus Thorarchaeota archaeon]|nr:MBL fold metallo-hydrolase [Candidatus Thorarchaeota archaeon]
MKSKLILLGTGTPNPDANRAGPSIAIAVNGLVYIIDFGTGVVRRAVQAGLDVTKLTRAFLTHLHSDHTIGYPDLIFTPGVAGRTDPLEVYGPQGLTNMTNHIMAAYEADVNERVSGLEPAVMASYIVNTHEIAEGKIYQDDRIEVDAFRVNHGSLKAYGFRFVTPDRTYVISGDTSPSQKLIEVAKGCDVLIHEVYSAVGLESRTEAWQRYHSTVHTSSYELAGIVNQVKPGLLIMYHQLLWGRTEKDLLSEVSELYSGKIISGHDLDVY